MNIQSNKKKSKWNQLTTLANIYFRLFRNWKAAGKVFYSVISGIEKEHVANGYGESHVRSQIEDYEAAKEARRSALLDKAIYI